VVREGRVFISSGSKPDFGSTYSVQALEVGAQVTSTSSGTSIAVRAGHGFAAGDKVMRGTDVTTFSATNVVSSVTSTTVVMVSAYAVAAGDLLVNLAVDSSTSATPAYDGAGLTVYTTMDYTATATSNTVATDANGRYIYYQKGIAVWELVRTGTTPIALYTDVNSVRVGFDLGKASTLAEATEIRFSRDGTQVWGIGEDYWAGIPASYFALWSYKGTTGTSGDIFGVSWFGAETENVHGGVGGSDSPKWFFNEVPYGNYASPWTYKFMGGNKTGTSRQALFGHLDYSSAVQGGVDIYFSGTTVDGIELRNDDGSSYRSTVKFSRVTAAGGSTVNASWLIGMGIGASANRFSLYDEIATSTRLYFNSTGSSLLSNASGTYTPTYVFDHLAEGVVTNADTIPWALRYRLSSGTAAVGLGMYQSYRIPDAGGDERQGGAIGIKVTDATAGALKSNIELWSSYLVAAVLTCTHTQKVGININAPVQTLDVLGSLGVTTGIVLATGAAPTVAASQVGLGATVAATATAGGGQAALATVLGYLVANVAGTTVKIPYFSN
jgi:hypothetical protein